MSNNNHGRIPTEPNKFVAYMDATDNYQLSDDPDNPGNPLYKKWTWTAAESAAWTAYRVRADELFLTYNDTDFVNKNVRTKMMRLIEEVQEYDHDKDNGHGLLDLVGLKGNIDDCEKFHVKRGTELADENPTHAEAIGMKKPVIALRRSAPGEHELTVTNPDTPESKALPDGVLLCEVFRYIGTVDKPPVEMKDYEYIGVAKRGLFLSTFEKYTFDRTKKYYAWYFARYKNKAGEQSGLSNEVIALIDDSGSRGIAN